VEEEVGGGPVRSATIEVAARVVLAAGAAPAEPSCSANRPSLYRRASQPSCAVGASMAELFPRSAS
jgi:hypothetical protein